MAADRRMRLELKDGLVFDGFSFGADASIAGELVFQTGMVGYPESITDPSYRGQILVITFPLVGNYGVPSRQARDKFLNNLPLHFEAEEIHIKGLIVASYCGDEYSHYLAESSLGAWLKEQNVPAMYGIDTRALTKYLRERGSTLGRLLIDAPLPTGVAQEAGSSHGFKVVDWYDPNVDNLVAAVSCPKIQEFHAQSSTSLRHPSGRNLRVVCVDVGLKHNQIRCLVNRGVDVLRVPFDFDFHTLARSEYDGLFISNGPGDPAMMVKTVTHIRLALQEARTPIFGICLGHQLMALAAGAMTSKMKFGNRGHNIPCTNLLSGRCYITSQNHGFQVDASTLPERWEPLFQNANDGSNEGIRNVDHPFFSVQFHPESTPGPRDTEFLFDIFIDAITKSVLDPATLQRPVHFPGLTKVENDLKFPRVHARKVLVLGSGGLSIGQAGEFDYSGSQAIKALKEEGIYTVLINPNIATIQTSKGLADKVYFLPVTADSVRKVIKHERPDAIYVTFGGQTALQVGIQLKDEFESLGVKVLGTPIETIITTEDRELFARSMESIGEKCAKSASANTTEEAVAAAKDIGYPVIIRAAYALGGLGSGFADNEQELLELCGKAFAASPQVLVERSMKGWKEIEYEVVRDSRDNCITVCNMENFDPLGIHTGDSIVVAPSQTLSDEDYNMLRTTAVNVIRHLGVVGECNIQYALNPFSKEYCIIEVNARLSRSSALASKATGYPLAFVAAKLGLNIPLDQIRNSVTQSTCACFEPSLDYVVVKIPRWDLKKFTRVSTALNSAMKSVGEVMSIGRSFEEAIQKAIRAIDYSNLGFNDTNALMSIDAELQTPSDQRLFAIANAMHSGYTVDKIWEMTKIDKWFLYKLKRLSNFAKTMTNYNEKTIPIELLKQAKQLGFSDKQLAKFWSISNEETVRQLRLAHGISPVVKQIDTVAAEFPAMTNYLYLTYNGTQHDVKFNDNGVMVLGSGVYRIGSSVEFDWCSVRTIRTLRAEGFKTVMINYNPETVSTDYDEADRLYFENITLETVRDIYDLENSYGAIISMGGQTPNNIAMDLFRRGVKILGTSPEMIDSAEDRYKFSRMLDRIFVDQPAWKKLTSVDEAAAFCDAVTYPVLVRPSYVLSGAAMNTVYSQHDLANFLGQAADVSPIHPVVITKYIENAKEIEMDAVALDGQLIQHFISEHVENAGVHSGDATLILPPQDLEQKTIKRIEEATRKIANALNITGPLNIQFIAKDNEIKVIECNVRASRSFPFVSKVMGIDLIEMATKAIMGLPVSPYPSVQVPADYVGVKVPQFSFSRLSGADPILGVEMASTGEVACFGRDKYEAYLKAFISTGFKMPKKNILFSIGSYKEKMEMLPSIIKLHQMGFSLFATTGTADFLQEHGVPVKILENLSNGTAEQKEEYSLTQHLGNNLIDLCIVLPSSNRFRRPANYISTGYRTRRMAVDYQVPLVTNVKNAKILIEAIARLIDLDEVLPIDYQTSHRIITLPGLINVAAFVPGLITPNSQDLTEYTKASTAAGFSMVRVLPLGPETLLTDPRTLKLAQSNAKTGAYCDYNLSVAANGNNVEQAGQILSSVASLYIPMRQAAASALSALDISHHFESWPKNRVIVTDAKNNGLAAILLQASLENRKLHVTNVTTAEDINMIAKCKRKGLEVTCDVSIYALFLSQAEMPECTFLPTAKDQKVLWEKLSIIDVFSIGIIPYQLASVHKQANAATVGIADALPLLLTAVHDGRLKVEDITSRMHDIPKKIFELHDQDRTTLEVELDRPYAVATDAAWSPFSHRTLRGAVKRVNFMGRTIWMDGILIQDVPQGKDMSSHTLSIFSPAIPAKDQPQTPLVEPVSAFQQRKQSIFTSPLPARRQETMPLDLGPSLQDPQSLHLSVPGRGANLSAQVQQYLHSSPFKGKHVVSVKDVSRQALHILFTVAQELALEVERRRPIDILAGRILGTLFYEPSTRTSASFDAAMQRIGGGTIPISTAHSSVQKGETLQDTIRTLACYCDAIVMRHPDHTAPHTAVKYSPVPIINGGNGSVEHPTQAFLDLYTIREELGTVNGLTITFVGDLKYGRTVHSVVKLLAHYDVKVQLVSPAALSLPADVQASLVSSGQLTAVSELLTPQIIAASDVLYCTRVQKERFEDVSEYERLKDALVVNNKTLKFAKQRMIVMHPLPRNMEVAEEIDTDLRARYFKQMQHGMHCRMALLALILA